MNYVKLCALLLCSVLTLTTLPGCIALLAGGAAGAGSVVYVKGQLKDTVNAPVTAVHSAASATLKELSLPIIQDNHDTLSARMKSRFADGQDVWIEVDYVTLESSRITVRVGIIGDERKSRQILDGIYKQLKESGYKT